MIASITRWIRFPWVAVVVVRAIRLRNAARWGQAAAMFERAIPHLPNHQQVRTQAGNCRKEQGQFAQALAHYDSVDHPDHRGEALFQKAHVLLKLGDREAALAALSAASALQHGNAGRLLRELDGGEAGFASIEGPVRAGPFPRLDRPLDEAALPKRLAVASGSRRWLRSLDKATHKPATERGFGSDPHLTLVQVGWQRLENGDAEEILLLGVVAIRARIVARQPLARVAVLLDGEEIAMATPALVKQGKDGWFYVVNAWIDCQRHKPQRAKLAMVASDAGGARLSAGVIVNLGHAPPGFALPDSDAYVPSPAADDPRGVAEAVLARPAQVRDARRSLFSGPIAHIVAMRVDQVGDIAASLPAMQRLRAVFPTARLSGVVSPGLVEVVRATGIFDAVHAAELIYSHASEQRFIEPEEERRLRALFAGYRVDLAVDLCPGGETRGLLRLFAARYLAGFDPHLFDFLDFGVTVRAQDKANRQNALSHAAQVMTLIEALAVAASKAQPSVARLSDDSAWLASLGLTAGDYVVIHTGARHAINCWPLDHFLDLAARIARECDRQVVVFADQPLTDADRATLQPADRIIVMPRVSTDQFDALLARARLFIGNDSGPKHLAAVHGVDTVSIHINRVNWREWGQDGTGLIISKPVPCAGCGLNNEALCGMEVACIRRITVDEIMPAVMRRLSARNL